MSDAKVVRLETYFSVAGALTCISMIFGVGYVLLPLPGVRPSPSIMTLLGLTAGSIIFSMVQSIRLIGRGLLVGWGALLANCFLVMVVAPILALHVWIAMEAMR